MQNTRTPPHIGEVQDTQGLLWRAVARDAQAGPARARLILTHGVGGNEMNMAALAAAVDPRVDVRLVRGPLVFAPGQFGWFQVSFGPSGPVIDALQAETGRERLIALAREWRRNDAQAGGAPLPTVVAGFSQGGIMSAISALTSPADLAGFGVLSGRILPEIAPVIASAEALAGTQGFIGHGRFDNKLPVDWAHRADRWLTELGVRHETHLYDLGHEIDAQVVQDFCRWLAGPLALD